MSQEDPAAHVGGPIIGPGCLTVIVEGQPLARATDRAMCVGGPMNYIVTGAATVLACGQPAAREGEHLMHSHGTLTRPLAATVFIGGPSAGCTLGDSPGAKKACEEAAKGRKPQGGKRGTNQSYENCGVESSRQIINSSARKGNPVSEDDLLDDAMDNGLADREKKRDDSGGTSPDEREKILDRYGVDNHQEYQNHTNVEQNVADGHGVITRHDADRLWGDGPDGGGHAILTTGVVYDENGRWKEVIVNDTGRSSGNCARRYPAHDYKLSLKKGTNINVTDKPIW